MRQRLVLCLVLAAAPAFAAAQDGAADTPGYQLETVASGLDMPWCVAFLPDGGFLVTELGGTLRRVGADGTLGDPVAGVPQVYRASQGGLFDVLLAPDFRASRVLYLSYAEGPPDSNTTAVARARLAGDALADVEVIFRVAPRKDTPVHYGGRLAWHRDGTLLLTTGDGFDYREAAQDLDSQMGKVVRMNPDGTPAEGNPFPEAPYVWSYGHRNPQGLSVAADGTVWLHEHGPKGGDEVNIVEPGVNYGWPVITYGLDYNGALLRLNPDGSVPEDNPFVDRDEAQPEIWTYGNRNIQGMALRANGQIWTHEHGPQGGDEVNLMRAGVNYGWPVITYGRNYGIGTKIGEGTEKEGMAQPVHQWTPSIAPSGMTFYDGEAFPHWQGDLFAGSLKFGLLVRLTLDGDEVVAEERMLDNAFGRIRAVAEGPDGMLWLLTDERNGKLLKITPTD